MNVIDHIGAKEGNRSKYFLPTPPNSILHKIYFEIKEKVYFEFLSMQVKRNRDSLLFHKTKNRRFQRERNEIINSGVMRLIKEKITTENAIKKPTVNSLKFNLIP